MSLITASRRYKGAVPGVIPGIAPSLSIRQLGHLPKENHIPQMRRQARDRRPHQLQQFDLIRSRRRTVLLRLPPGLNLGDGLAFLLMPPPLAKQLDRLIGRRPAGITSHVGSHRLSTTSQQAANRRLKGVQGVLLGPQHPPKQTDNRRPLVPENAQDPLLIVIDHGGGQIADQQA